MSEFWNEKYKGPNYHYGTQANEYFKSELLKLPPGNLLLPAEGEGRNGLFAALNSWKVTAFDVSDVGREKALELARKNKVSINYMLLGYDEIDFAENSFDAIGLTFCHLPPKLRKIMHQKYITWLKPGGYILLEAFSKEQLQYNSGGPKDIDMLFSQEELITDFEKLTDLQTSILLTELNEGDGHKGKASVIRLVGRKKK
jgi:hypothetical protein